MEVSNPLNPYLSVLVPCYRDEAGLDELHRRLTAVCERLGKSYEIVLVEDGSPDRTWDAICRLAEKDSRIVGLQLSRNHGHQLAVTAGLAHVRGERVLIIDSDLQDPPELLRLMDEGADNVYGQRLSRISTSRSNCHSKPSSGDFPSQSSRSPGATAAPVRRNSRSRKWAAATCSSACMSGWRNISRAGTTG